MRILNNIGFVWLEVVLQPTPVSKALGTIESTQSSTEDQGDKACE